MLAGDGAEREFGPPLEPLDELQDAVAEDAGAVVVDDERNAQRHVGDAGLDNLAVLAPVLDDEVAGTQVGDGEAILVEDAHIRRARLRFRRTGLARRSRGESRSEKDGRRRQRKHAMHV